jgi:tRNA-Thr(GGU) m(6)t(6)A37 methyltransferase TsaA
MNADTPKLQLDPIGHMRTAHAAKVDAPRQPAAAPDAPGIIELLPGRNLEHAIEDLAGWERIWVVFWFHRNQGWRPKVLPPRSTTGRKGVLATRSPHRPNPLGLSVLRLDRVEGLRLHVRDVDLLDGTPILDIKPYVAYTDSFPESGNGWLADKDPRPSHVVVFADLAQRQLSWIGARTALPLQQRIEETLRLGAQPHPYRRIRPNPHGGMTLAVQDWRVDFHAEGLSISVVGIRTGYRHSQLLDVPPDARNNFSLHREFMSTFAAD